MVKAKKSGYSSSGNSAQNVVAQDVIGTEGAGGALSAEQPQGTQGGKPTINATAMTEKEWQAKYDAQKPNAAQKSASYDYTYPYATSTGYSPSQNMNYKLDTG